MKNRDIDFSCYSIEFAKYFEKIRMIMKRVIKLSTMKNCLLPLLLPFFIVLSGCASFGKGIAEAVLEKNATEDTRVCQVRGKSFK